MSPVHPVSPLELEDRFKDLGGRLKLDSLQAVEYLASQSRGRIQSRRCTDLQSQPVPRLYRYPPSVLLDQVSQCKLQATVLRGLRN